jgi:hypothetical protein
MVSFVGICLSSVGEVFDFLLVVIATSLQVFDFLVLIATSRPREIVTHTFYNNNFLPN